MRDVKLVKDESYSFFYSEQSEVKALFLYVNSDRDSLAVSLRIAFGENNIWRFTVHAHD